MSVASNHLVEQVYWPCPQAPPPRIGGGRKGGWALEQSYYVSYMASHLSWTQHTVVDSFDIG